MNHFHTTMRYMTYLYRAIFSDGVFKLVCALVASAFGFLFGTGIQLILFGLVVLVFFDFLTGIMAAFQMGLPIQSRKALHSAIKLGVYGILVSSAHITQSVVHGFDFMDIGMTAFLSATEFISIMENAGKMGYSVPLKLLNQIKSWQRSSRDIDDDSQPMAV